MNVLNVTINRLLHSCIVATSIRSNNLKVTFPSIVSSLSLKHHIIQRPFHKTPANRDSSFDTESSDSDSENGDVMDLKKVVKRLRALAPTTLAADWDNVGLLIEPSSPHIVNCVLLTNDLTLPVLDEAVEKEVGLVVSYHPPIFVPLKRLTQRNWKELIALRCIENRIAVYSPHTACDAVQGGVNDWLMEPFSGKVEVIEKSYNTAFPLGGGYRLEFAVPGAFDQRSQKDLESGVAKVTGITVISRQSLDNGTTRLCLNCTEKAVPKVVEFLNDYEQVKCSLEIFKTEKPPIPNHGQGRLCKLSTPLTLQEAIKRVKGHLGLTHVRVATAVGASYESPLKSVAVCAGSGSSVLRGVEADLYISGEMSHHDVLDATHHGVNVILCDHSNTERGYLRVIQEQLRTALDGQVEVMLSEKDRDPLEVV